MWKPVDEISAQNQQAGLPAQHDPFQWLDSMVVEVERLTLEGEYVVFATCCESARLKRGDVLAWREVPGEHGNPSLFEARIRMKAPVIAQRAAYVGDEQACRRCGRAWTGLPPARGPSDRGAPARDPREHDRRDGDRDRGHGHGEPHGCGCHGGGHHGHDHGGCGCHGHNHHGHHHGHGGCGEHGYHEHRHHEHGGPHEHHGHHDHGGPDHGHGGPPPGHDHGPHGG